MHLDSVICIVHETLLLPEELSPNVVLSASPQCVALSVVHILAMVLLAQTVFPPSLEQTELSSHDLNPL